MIKGVFGGERDARVEGESTSIIWLEENEEGEEWWRENLSS